MAVWQYLERFVAISLTTLLLAGFVVACVRVLYNRYTIPTKIGRPLRTTSTRSSVDAGKISSHIPNAEVVEASWFPIQSKATVEVGILSSKTEAGAATQATGHDLLTNAETVPLSDLFDCLVISDIVPSLITLQARAYPSQGWSREAHDMFRRYPLHVSHGTRWWQTESPTHVALPPSMVEHPFARTGDIFMHKWKGGVQFWVLEVSDLGNHAWKRVRFGYGRSDGKRLSMTEDKLAPAWLSANWYMKTREDRMPLMSPL